MTASARVCQRAVLAPEAFVDVVRASAYAAASGQIKHETYGLAERLSATIYTDAAATRG